LAFLPCDSAKVRGSRPIQERKKPMNRFIAAAAFVAAQWQPAHAQAILGSIPEEFLGDWCSQEKTNGEEIFRPGACKLKPGSLSIDRMTLDTGRLSCVFESGTASDGNHPDADALHRYRGKATVDVRCPAQATAWQEDRTHHGADGVRSKSALGGEPENIGLARTLARKGLHQRFQVLRTDMN
jgi:hypothetical protein